MPVISRDVTLQHRLQKSAEPAAIPLAAGTQVSVIKEWAGHFLIRTADGKVFNIQKSFVDTSR